MSRAKGTFVKRAACLLVVAALAIPFGVRGNAADSDTLYFGALEEKVAQNVKTATVTKSEFYVTGAVQASLEFSSNQYVVCDAYSKINSKLYYRRQDIEQLLANNYTRCTIDFSHGKFIK